ncbi:adenylate cyclase associated N terminal-domain-containing protein [Pterulicium gracile]|uniref:Adenylyl cyclase-associated protein n=1 Tax=Pterulicium gracile TaxID=1884261 RepID=A0A5C3QZ91_9AGAR|nr:adenylate cyclase associated N terminal-domain-containing protein [Pterula gracilis]
MTSFAGSGLNSLATIIKRLEAATARLEDITAEQSRGLDARGGSAPNANGQSSDSQSESTPSASSQAQTKAAPPKAEDPKSVVAFDNDVLKGSLVSFVELTSSFANPALIEQVKLFEQEFHHLRDFIALAASCHKPKDQTALGELLGPLQKDITAITHFVETHRQDREYFNHFQTLGAAAPFAAWVAGDTKPGPYVEEMKNSSTFYGNKVIKDFKEKEPKHVEWVRSLNSLLDKTRAYVMEHHTTGLVWNPKGVSPSEFQASASAKGASGGGAPPPPPPPPPPAAAPTASAAAAGGAGAVFAELNRGEDVTKGLRKVDKSEMTHKNPSLRASSASPVPSSPAKKPTRPLKPASLSGKKPAKFALEGNKWMLEYQENENGLIIEDGQNNQIVNLFGLKNSTVQIKGKVNAVTLVNCTKVSILVESVISSISVTKSPSFVIQITGSAPTIQIDSTDSGQIYLSETSLGVEITTAKCSSINVNLPVEGEEQGVFQEQSMPEMLKTTIVKGKLVTSIVEHTG